MRELSRTRAGLVMVVVSAAGPQRLPCLDPSSGATLLSEFRNCSSGPDRLSCDHVPFPSPRVFVCSVNPIFQTCDILCTSAIAISASCSLFSSSGSMDGGIRNQCIILFGDIRCKIMFAPSLWIYRSVVVTPFLQLSSTKRASKP